MTVVVCTWGEDRGGLAPGAEEVLTLGHKLASNLGTALHWLTVGAVPAATAETAARFFSNEGAAHLGFQPQDSAEDYRAKVEAKCPPGDPFDPTIEFAGGFMCGIGHPDDEA